MNFRAFPAMLLACAALAACPLAGAESPSMGMTSTIGGTPIVLPVLRGFDDPSATPKAMVDLLSHALPATNRLLAIMLQADFMADASSGDPQARPGRRLVVLTFPQYEQDGMSPALFESTKTVLRTQGDQYREQLKDTMAGLTDRLSKDLGKRSGDDTSRVRNLDLNPLGVYDEQPDSISLSGLQTAGRTIQGKTTSDIQAMATTAMLIHGKPVMVSVYSHYRSAADVEWVKSEALEWARRLRQANP
jgi:hypothetical protein